MIHTLLSVGVSPACILLLGGILSPLFPRKLQPCWVLILPLLTLAYIWQMPLAGFQEFESHAVALAGFPIIPIHVHAYSHIFATVFCIAAFAGGLFALNQKRPLELAAALVYAGGAVGISFSGDFITLFLFWELMAVASTFIVWHGGTDEARAAGLRYAAMHFFGGVLLLAGIAAHINAGGNFTLEPLLLTFNDLSSTATWDMGTLSGWLILAGILINIAAPPLSSWLPDAYPESSISGMVFLSAFTTKAAVFVLLTLFAGNQVLIYIGLFMAFYGIIYAILENDMRRILAYSIINQVGFMVTGAGIGTPLAMNGAAAHAFCHIIYKALLLMSAGSVLYMTGRRRCSELGGLWRTMHVTMVCGIIGALSISAFPYTSGFISKSMVSAAAHVPEMEIVWYLLLAASAGVFLHAGIKFPWFVFFNRDSGLRPQDPPANMQLAMILLSILCLVPGFFPHSVYFMLPATVAYDAYAEGHAISQLQLLLFSGLAFFMLLPLLKRTRTVSLDFDWLYRVPAKYLLLVLDRAAFYMKGLLERLCLRGIDKTFQAIFHLHGPNGVMARNWPIGITVLWSAFLLGGYLLLYYIWG